MQNAEGFRQRLVSCPAAGVGMGQAGCGSEGVLTPAPQRGDGRIRPFHRPAPGREHPSPSQGENTGMIPSCWLSLRSALPCRGAGVRRGPGAAAGLALQLSHVSAQTRGNSPTQPCPHLPGRRVLVLRCSSISIAQPTSPSCSSLHSSLLHSSHF